MGTCPQNPSGPPPSLMRAWHGESGWILLVESLEGDDPAARTRGAAVIGYMLGYARQTRTRMLALAEDREHGPFRLLFFFNSGATKDDFLRLLRLNEATARGEDEILIPQPHEIRVAQPLEFVLPNDILSKVLELASEVCSGEESDIIN